MTSVIQSAKDGTPYTISILLNACSFGLKEIDAKESCVTQFGVLSGVEGCCLLGTFLGSIETVFWGAIFLLTKTFHLFIPRSFTAATSICGFTYRQFTSSLIFTTISVTGLVTNFFTSTGDEFLESSKWITHPLGNGLDACDGIVNYQLF